jgi:dGTPase
MPSTMEWPKLLSHGRLTVGESTSQPGRTQFQRDYDRILFSTAFRRLHDKTQVFPMPKNDHVHSRLTHTLETASVGRTLGIMCGEHILDRHEDWIRDYNPSDFGDIVAAACLSHDIGNPPFGHAGERAIAEWFVHWFENDPEGQKIAKKLTDAEREDLRNFEGNAQGFRVIARLEREHDAGGMRLTYATLGAFSKYPQSSPNRTRAAGASRKKFSYFQSELSLFKETAAKLGLLKRDAPEESWFRHPLVFLMEAADDICYRILDIEDGYVLKHIPYKVVEDRLAAIIKVGDPTYAPTGSTEADKVRRLRADAIHQLIQEAAKVFKANELEILRGEFDKSLCEHIPSAAHLTAVESENRKYCYVAPEVVQVEAAGYEVLGRMLRKFVPAVLAGEPTNQQQALLRLLPPEATLEATTYKKIMRVTDFISGMTDTYAVNLYRGMHGVSLPGQLRV